MTRKLLSERPTKRWRVQGTLTEAKCKPLGDFDELVVGEWLHVEMMDTRRAWIRVGTRVLNVRIKRDGTVVINEMDDP